MASSFTGSSSRRKKQGTAFPITVKPRRPCPVCGRWTTAIYMHMIYSHNWTEEQVNELKREIREERMVKRGSAVYVCYRCGLGYASSTGLCMHLAKCRLQGEHKTSSLSPLKTEKEKHFMWYLGGRQTFTRLLPCRPLLMPPLPEQLSESKRGSVLCPVPHCIGRFTNHDSLSYHCMIEHSELGAAGTPQNFAIRQYRFEDKESFKEWLFERCEETCTSFSTKTSLWSGYAMYRCNRAGTFKNSGTVRSGCISKKAQSHCSAFLRTNEYNDGSIDVTCCFGHIAHELDPTALRLNERQCAVLQKLLEQNVYLTDICAQMKSEYPPTNRLHYTSANDIRNLALRLGLSIRLKDRKALRRSPNYNAKECTAAVSAHSSGYFSLHSNSEDECTEIEDQHVDEGDDMHEEKDLSNEQVNYCEENLNDLLPTPLLRASTSPEGTDTRPSRIRRAPRRFGDS